MGPLGCILVICALMLCLFVAAALEAVGLRLGLIEKPQDDEPTTGFSDSGDEQPVATPKPVAQAADINLDSWYWPPRPGLTPQQMAYQKWLLEQDLAWRKIDERTRHEAVRLLLGD